MKIASALRRRFFLAAAVWREPAIVPPEHPSACTKDVQKKQLELSQELQHAADKT
ncbi:hypothetical protein AB4Y40_07755 [Paraburkholderia sp. EG287B]|uniref:hypothetical protein n=1 Tax=unclassified Paraburkholderia TaxID=2615204 RepID=UPI0034D2E647